MEFSDRLPSVAIAFRRVATREMLNRLALGDRKTDNVPSFCLLIYLSHQSFGRYLWHRPPRSLRQETTGCCRLTVCAPCRSFSDFRPVIVLTENRQEDWCDRKIKKTEKRVASPSDCIFLSNIFLPVFEHWGRCVSLGSWSPIRVVGWKVRRSLSPLPRLLTRL